MSSNCQSCPDNNCTPTAAAPADDPVAVLLASPWFGGSLVALVCLFLAVVFESLCRLTKGRSAIIIMANKAVATFLYNLFQWSNYTVYLASDGRYTVSSAFRHTIHVVVFLNCAVRLHVLLLALNRATSVFLPFSYNKWAKKRTILKQCALVWWAAVGVAVAVAFTDLYIDVPPADQTPLNSAIYLVATQGSIYASIVLYAALLAKLFWLRMTINSWGKCDVEQDHMRVVVACAFSLTPFLLNFVPYLVQGSALYVCSTVLQDVLYLLQLLTNTVAHCAEELCLLAICADFRRILRRRWLVTLFSLKKKEEAINKHAKGATTMQVVKRSAIPNAANTNNNALGISKIFVVDRSSQLPAQGPREI